MATIVLFFQFYIQKCPVGKTFIGHSWIVLQFRDLKYTIETALEGVHSLIILHVCKSPGKPGIV